MSSLGPLIAFFNPFFTLFLSLFTLPGYTLVISGQIWASVLCDFLLLFFKAQRI
jgi:hypothetical protein